MNWLLLLLAAIVCTTVSEPLGAQTIKAYQERSEDFYNAQKFDSALYYAWLAEPLTVDTFGKRSLEYASFMGQYIAMNYEELRNVDSALYWYRYSIDLFEALNDTISHSYGESLTNYGNLLNNTGSFTKAFPYLYKAFSVLNRYPEDPNGYFGSKNNLANYYQSMGEYSKAEILYQQIFEETQKIPGAVTTAKSGTMLLNLAALNNKSGYTQLADQFYKRGLDSLRKDTSAKNKYYEAASSYALFCLGRNDVKLAESVLIKLLGDPFFKINNFINTQDRFAAAYALALSCLGNVNEAKKNNRKAEALYKQAIDVSASLTILPFVKYGAVSNLAHLYTSAKQYGKADSVYEKLIPDLDAEADRDEYTYTKIYGNYCENLLHLRQTEKASAIIRNFTVSLLQVINKNIGSMPEEKQMRYIASLERYISLMFSAIATGTAPQPEMVAFSLNNLLHLKGLVLNLQLQKMLSLRSSSDSVLYKLNNDLKIIKEALYYAYTNKQKPKLYLDSLEAQARSYENKISTITGTYYANRKAPPADGILNKLSGGQAAVEFVYYTNAVTGNKMYGAFVMRYGKEDYEFIELCTEKKLKESLLSFSGKIFNPENQLNNAAELYRLIWKPLEKCISGFGAIYYSPAGLLNYIAFDAIVLPSGKHLLGHKKMLLVSSTRSLLNNRSNNETLASATVWGNIDFSAKAYAAGGTPNTKDLLVTKGLPDDIRKGGNTTVFPPLPQDEVPEIIKLAKRKKLALKVYEKDQATEENFKRDAATYSGLLHLSTHGFYYNQSEAKHTNASDDNAFRTHVNPLLRCGLILKGGNYAWAGKQPLPGTEDGILTGYEIAMLDLSKINLVVLSACETGLGDIDASSEGILGLQRAFKLAGVQNMVLSLWSVNAAFTKQLMMNFYNYLLNGENAATALYEAKKQMAKNNPPYAWAGFVLVE